ncbi:TPA: hypothetical protein ACQ71T_004974 [Escherichia coli]
MKYINIIALFISIFIILLFSYWISGAPSDAAFFKKINPLDAFRGLSFALAWGYISIPFLSFLVALLIFATVFGLVFFISRLALIIFFPVK